MEEKRKTIAESNAVVKEGNILTVQDKEICFNGMQGQVAQIIHGQIGLVFDERIYKCSWAFFGPRRYQAGEVEYFERNQLVLDEGWTIENMLKMLFPYNNYIVISLIKNPFVPGKPCMRKDCHGIVTKRIFVNIHGHVVAFDVCDDCNRQYNGACVPDFPLNEKRKGKVHYNRQISKHFLK